VPWQFDESLRAIDTRNSEDASRAEEIKWVDEFRACDAPPLDQAGALPNSLSPMKAEGGAVIDHPALLAGGKASQFRTAKQASTKICD